jgi:hypothetical protein
LRQSAVRNKYIKGKSMAEKFNFEFKVGIYDTRHKSYSLLIPETGNLPIYQLAVKGGDKRAFWSSQETDNYMDIGSEIEQMKRYRNIGFVRKSDLYSVEFLNAKLKRATLSIGIGFQIFEESTKKLTTSMAAFAHITEFEHRIKKGERFDYMLFKLWDIDVHYHHSKQLKETTES